MLVFLRCVYVGVCVCGCGMLICFVSALGSHEMGRHKLRIIIIIIIILSHAEPYSGAKLGMAYFHSRTAKCKRARPELSLEIFASVNAPPPPPPTHTPCYRNI